MKRGKIIILLIFLFSIIPNVCANNTYFKLRTYNSNTTDKYIYDVDEKTSLNSYKTYFELNSGYSIDVNLSGKEYIYTGSKLIIYKNGTKTDEYVNIVFGDINGDGKISTMDYVKVKNHIMNKNKLTGVYLKSADVNEDKNVSSLDYITLKNLVMGAKRLTLELNSNGATVSKNSLHCISKSSGCSVTLPTITTTKTVVGWGNAATSKTSDYNVGTKITLTKNKTLYAITKKTLTATFNKNAADGLSYTTKSCDVYNADTSCSVTTPTITTTKIAVGFNSSATGTTSEVGQNSSLTITGNKTLYAIIKKTLTATFYNTNLDYLEYSSKSCTVYNSDSSCSIKLPRFNRKGYFNNFWSENPVVSSNLSGTSWSWSFFQEVGRDYTISKDVTLYPNFNEFHYDLDKNYCKYRSFSINKTETIGNVLFEFENGIPQRIIDKFINEMNTAYSKIPWLFTPGKVFVMTETTYNNYSIAYGLTHWMYEPYGGDSYFTVDIQYDTGTDQVSSNAALHELAHAWDSYYKYKTNKTVISEEDDFDTFYNYISPKLYINNEGEKISKVETFAGMVTNYYWHVLGVNNSESYYAMAAGQSLSSTDSNKLKTFMEKYIGISQSW